LGKKTVKGILADIHMKGPVDALVREMQAEPWAELWKDLGLHYLHFEDVGLTPTSTDSGDLATLPGGTTDFHHQ
jgi:hypothetical protein